jgi:hypothetical protein
LHTAETSGLPAQIRCLRRYGLEGFDQCIPVGKSLLDANVVAGVGLGANEAALAALRSVPPVASRWEDQISDAIQLLAERRASDRQNYA